ncbi:MAG: bifunctional metallophosphatase/5'-nucleotidase [Ruminococcaceae bacterium]|nr:bifunctional metallophosphatase/5'-nucleotidase [Oscillospiraceae bacterium]
MRTFKKSLALLLALVMVLALGVNAFAADEMLISLDPVGDVTVYYTNDVHTYINKENTYSKVAALKDSTPNALLVDAGDAIQGTAYGSMDKGETIIKLMNAAGYDVATLGNHEFDYGQDGRINATDVWAEFPYVSANFYNEKDGVKGAPVLDAYKVFEVNGLKIAFVGITTPESFTKSTPAYFQDEAGNYIYGISAGADMYADVQKAIDAAAKEADVVIGLGHLGDDPTSTPNTSEELIANICGLDAFIDGHSHSTVPMKEVADKDGHTVILTQTGEYLDAVGKMTITADGAVTTELLTDLSNVTPDAEVKAIEDAWIAELDTKLGEVIGSVDFTFDNYDADGNRLVRKQETNTGDFCADALYYLFDNMDMDVDFAIMNGGGIRNKALTGEISYKFCKTIHTFGNVACLQTITGQQLLDALEWGAKAAGTGENGGFLHVSGLKYNINTYIPSTVQADEKGVWCGAPTGEYRVSDVQVLNNETGVYEPLKLDGKYNLAGYNYTLRDLGDGFAMFDGAVNVLDYVMEDYMVLANYVQSFEGGKVTGYAEPQGRITQKASPFTDVAPSDWFFSYVVAMASDGVIDGMGDGTYAPATELTWAQALKLLLTAHGDLKDATGANWSKATIAKAASLGLVSVDLDGTQPISRLDFCKVAANLYDVEPSVKESAFTDCDNAYVTALVKAGVINGMGGTIFAPDATLTRAQIAKILYCLDK